MLFFFLNFCVFVEFEYTRYGFVTMVCFFHFKDRFYMIFKPDTSIWNTLDLVWL